MNKKQLISRISESNDLESKAAATRVLDLITNIITEQIALGNEVVLGQNIGKFVQATQKAKSGTMNGKAWATDAKHTVRFKVSASFKKLVASK
jgi:nucleoid DNA-binding protein